MRIRNQFFKVLTTVILTGALFACEEAENVAPDNQEEFDKAETLKRVEQRNQIDKLTFSLFSETLNGDINGRKSGNHRFSHLFNNKSKSGRSADDWDTCALINLAENRDGTYTLTLDYGDGCTEADGRFISGLVVFSGYETDTAGSFEITFKDFYERAAGETDDDPSKMTGYYKGGYEVDPSGDFDYAETFDGLFDLTYESGFNEKLETKGELFAKGESYEIRKHNAEGSNSEGLQFTSSLITPLVFDETCTESYIYVKGEEKYTFNGESVSVDYGDGNCDNILTVSTDAITITIDLDKVEEEG